MQEVRRYDVSGTALLHLSFIAVVVLVLLMAWMAMVLHAGQPPSAGQPETADPGNEPGATDDAEPTSAESLSAREGRRTGSAAGK
jgi:hypothetical protein